MPVFQKKSTTSNMVSQTSEQVSAPLPEQEDFRQHLRHLAVSAVQILIEQIMREELEQCIGTSYSQYGTILVDF